MTKIRTVTIMNAARTPTTIPAMAPACMGSERNERKIRETRSLKIEDLLYQIVE